MEEDDMMPPPPPDTSKPEKETKDKLSLPKPKDPRTERKNNCHIYLQKNWDW